MTTYWVLPSNPPDNLVDAWDLLYEKFGTEPFSRRQGVAVLMERYPSLARSNVDEVLDAFEDGGNLGATEREF